MRKLVLGAVVGMALVLVTLAPLLAAASPITFGHTWGTNAFEAATAVVVDGSGNVLIAGIQEDPATFSQKGFVAKFTPSGTLAWNREFPFAENASVDMSLAPGGDVYVLGMQPANGTKSGANGTFNGTSVASFVARISSAGNLVFLENFTEITYPQRIATDPSTGGFVILGEGPTGSDTVVAAFTSTGALRWAREAGAFSAFPGAVAVDGSGRVYVLLDRTFGNSAVDAFDANGNLSAQVVIGSYFSTYVYPTDLIVTSSGPLVLGQAAGQLFLSQLTSTLGTSWIELAGASGWYESQGRLAELSDGSFVTLGGAFAQFNSTIVSHLYHFSSSGSIVSGSAYLSPAESQNLGQGLAFLAGAGLANGGLVLAGTTLGVTPQTSTAVTVTTTVPGVSWSSDSLAWTSIGITSAMQSPTLLDPVVPVDNWNEQAAYQAWYGETNLPASKLTVTVTVTQSASSSTSVTFSTSVSGGRKPYTYSWSFGDGTFGNGSASPSHVYPGTGRYLAQVTVKDAGGNVGYGSAVVTVTGPPSILFIEQSPSGTVYAGNFVSFFAFAVDSDGGSISTYTWSFGDGLTDVTSYPDDYHVYNSPGNYSMTLTVLDSDQGLTATTSLNVTVVPRPDLPPVASFYYYPSAPSAGSSVYFYGYYSYDPDGYIVSYQWNFGDGSSLNTTGCCPVHAFAAVGNYTVSLTVTDNAGLTGTMNATIIVVPDVPPVADFVWSPTVPSTNETVFFNAGYFTYDPDGYIASWAWNFGDGTSGGGNGTGNTTGNGTNQGPFPTHVYATFGTFNVSLNATDNAGLSTVVSHAVYVNAPPTAKFTTSKPVGKVGTAVVFNASASSDPDGDPLNYTWWFGDGSTATGAVVSHVYAQPGQYLVSLQVSDPYVATFASEYFPVTLPKSPVAVIAWSPTHPVAGQTTVSFDGSNSFDPDGAITQYIWEFGDGTVGRGEQTTHVYKSAGTYTLELIVIDEDGIANRDSQTITVVAATKGTVTTANLQSPLAGATVTLTAQGAVALVVTTAADGTFALGGLAPGTYGIAITMAGYAPYAGVLVWDGIHGDLGTFVLTPLSSGSTGPFGVLANPAALLAMAIAGVAAVGAAAILVRRRRLAGRPPEP